MEHPTPAKVSKKKVVRKFVKRGVNWARDAISISRPSSPHSSALPGPDIPPTSSNHPESGTSPKTTTSESNKPPNSSRPKSESSPALQVPTTTPISSRVPTSDMIKEASGVAWNGLKTGLQVLEKISDVFPPLKSAVGALLLCLDVVETAAGNREDYEALSDELKIMANTLNRHVSNLAASEGDDGSVAYILHLIQEEAAHIEKQQTHGKGRRIIESPQDREDVLKRFRRIESLFRQLQSDINLRTWDTTRKLHETSLLQAISPVDAAGYNSSYSTTIKRRACTAETRKKTRDDLEYWVRNPNSAGVYWINGMAGTGKTTILYSLCKWLEDNRRLGGNFFCSRILESCRSANNIIPTLAYQLAHYSSAFRMALCNLLDKEPGAAKRDITYQFKKLILEPMKEVKNAIPEGVVIVVDALDECDDTSVVRKFLGIMLENAENLPIKFIITSRPEPSIRIKIQDPGFSPSILHLHDIEESIVEADIKKYLIEELHAMDPPPTSDQFEQLARRAGKLFIYAATAVRYICPDDFSVDSSDRLRTVLETASFSDSESSKQHEDLDRLYTSVLSAAFHRKLEQRETKNMSLVLWTVICAKEPMSVQTLASIISLEEKRVQVSLEPLRSVLHVQERGGLVSALHASFPEYMFDSSRSGAKFYCDRTRHSGVLTDGCFNIMKSQLQFNICHLESSFVYDKDVEDLDERIRTYISRGLSYACRYWGEHIREGTLTDVVYERLLEFLDHQLLFWMEVLNLEGQMAVGGEILWKTRDWLESSLIDIRKQVTDAEAFVRRYTAGACTRSTPHIYISALPFCSTTSSVYKNYAGRTRKLVYVKGSATEQWSDAAIATWTTDSSVLSIAFSIDGTRIVSGSLDDTIRVWDARTGDTVAGPFTGRTSGVNSVAFSPDGTYIASGSYDSTVRVWDARSGDALAEPFIGHTHCVRSVAFSPDGTLIVSGSDDKTIGVWNARTGDPIAEPFKGHTDFVRSVAFSPDGSRIVSGSDDHTIRIWDARTGDTVAGPFTGHTGGVNAAVFSPDGNSIVSGSYDSTIRIWDACTGDVIAEPFTGHTDYVRSVAFSPDGNRIVSGSDDQTIRVWNARTGDTVAGPFLGHRNDVRSVTFSPDGSRIVSGSNDSTIRVWDAHASDTFSGPFTGHTGGVNAVAFLPDANHIVSVSSDKTIRVWDAHTGDAFAEPFTGHADYVNSVAFSPDGNYIVSGSDDQTIQAWDALTGEAVAEPFTGHTGYIESLAFSPDGNCVVSGSNDHTIRVWDARNGDIIAGPFTGHTDCVRSVAFSPDGSRIVSGSNDRTIRVWDVRTGDTVTGPLTGHAGYVSSVAFSLDSNHIISGSYDKTIRVWDACTGDAVAEPFTGHTNYIRSIALSPDGTRIVSGSADQTIRVWDACTGETVAGPFTGHTNRVNSVAFSPDGTRIVSGSDDQTIRVWHILPKDANSRFTDILPSSLSYIQDFTFNKDGWLTVGNIPILWVSPNFHARMPQPRNTFIISSVGAILVDYNNLNIGDTWFQCFS